MEGRELPVGWSTSTGSEIFELVTSGSRGWAKYYSDNGPLFIRIGNLDHGSVELDLKDVQRVTPPNDSEGKRTRLEPNDILISITAELGMIALVPDDLGEAYVNQHVALARPVPEIAARFLAWYLASESDGKKQLLELKRGATKVGLGLPDIRNLILPLAPLNEQRRIAAKLDTTLAAVEACRQRLDGVTAILKRFRQAVLAAATSGELTREWREETGINSGWEDKELSSICLSIADGDHQAPPKADEGIPFITISAINDAVLRVGKATRYVPESYYNSLSETRKAREDDILFSVTGSVGIPALVDSQQRFVFQRHIALLRPNRAKVLPKFLFFRLLSDDFNRQCLKVATGTAQLTVSLGSLRSMYFRSPSLQEQAEINERVQDLFTLADQLEARLTTARKIADRLTPALLAKAFRGELVPQDPGDEPASVLLERIRAARQVEAAAGKPSRRGRRKAATNPDQIAMEASPVSADFLAGLLRECGALSERALLAVSELEPQRFQQQLYRELESGTAREVQDNGQVLLEAVG